VPQQHFRQSPPHICNRTATHADVLLLCLKRKKKAPSQSLVSQTSQLEYEAAIRREREAWQALFKFKRSDPQYILALNEWRASADALTALTMKDLVELKS
jgi:hypothetical protein